jgi:hypothetical protein
MPKFYYICINKSTMKTFEANRLTEGNKMFPTQITISNKGVVVKKPGIFSSEEKVIPYGQINYVNINTPLIGFSSIEFGTENQPVVVNGFTKSEVKEIQRFVLEMV